MSATVLDLGGIEVDLVWKPIKNLHLSVHPPTGRVTISAPVHLGIETIRAFAIAKLGWIRRHQRRLQAQPRESRRQYVSLESHYVWGERVLLEVVERRGEHRIFQGFGRLTMYVTPSSSWSSRDELMSRWYREQLRDAALPIMRRWAGLLGVAPNKLLVCAMRTKWGSCHPGTGNIRLNTELARKPRECLDYVLLHELAHLREPTHSANFNDLLDMHLPQWRAIRAHLNRLPLLDE